ncbi:fibroleukin-like [Drosophila sulfurigaster albostrigata]|uniref:fibroleukin-like n=1 Tax=Drosophila sulfurigaster albostrigata TaxID=89887 RepID=UPI002D219C20|nr:fibroleukin-like [Drosophila sulfurigaster albostrigata]
MEDKKLNIEFAENSACNLLDDRNFDHFDNRYDSSNNLNNGKETLIDVIQKQDCQINDLKSKLSELEKKVSMREEMDKLYRDKLQSKEDLIESLKLTNEPSKNNENYTQKNCELVTKNDNISIQMEYGGSKLSMKVPQLKSFEPVLENNIAGPGWIVIHRRVNGNCDFKRNEGEYYDGFGKRTGDFWLGLEKMHLITSHQRHELYVHIVDFDGIAHYAKYDNFVVGSRQEKGVLRSLGHYSGDANDMMRLNEGKAFSVATKAYKNGWWWMPNVKPTCNLSGKVTDTSIEKHEYIFWGYKTWGNKKNYIKSVQMLIRPIKELPK